MGTFLVDKGIPKIEVCPRSYFRGVSPILGSNKFTPVKFIFRIEKIFASTLAYMCICAYIWMIGGDIL